MSYEHVTLCFSLPRSRSQWLAWFFGQAVTSWHDPLKHCEHPLNLKWMIDQQPGKRLFIADTSAVLFHDAITRSLPGANFLYVLRDPIDVCASLKRETGFPHTSTIQAMNKRLVAAALGADYACTYERLDSHVPHWWRIVTGRSPKGEVEKFWLQAKATRIDTPVNEQDAYPEKLRCLMQHKEI